VQAISALCQKYPRKHSVMMNFLSNMLRDDVSGSLTDRRPSHFGLRSLFYQISLSIKTHYVIVVGLFSIRSPWIWFISADMLEEGNPIDLVFSKI